MIGRADTGMADQILLQNAKRHYAFVSLISFCFVVFIHLTYHGRECGFFQIPLGLPSNEIQHDTNNILTTLPTTPSLNVTLIPVYQTKLRDIFTCGVMTCVMSISCTVWGPLQSLVLFEVLRSGCSQWLTGHPWVGFPIPTSFMFARKSSSGVDKQDATQGRFALWPNRHWWN